MTREEFVHQLDELKSTASSDQTGVAVVFTDGERHLTYLSKIRAREAGAVFPDVHHAPDSPMPRVPYHHIKELRIITSLED